MAAYRLGFRKNSLLAGGGAVPPAGLTDWRYLAVAMAASWVAARALVEHLAHPVTLFDFLGLGLFAVTGE